MKDDILKVISAPWLQRLMWAAILGTACYVGSTTAIKKDIETLQTNNQSMIRAVSDLKARVALVESEQAKVIVFQESGEMFTQTHGKTLELKARDYTDQRIREAVNDIKISNAEIKSSINGLSIKLDKFIQLQLQK